MTTRVTKEMMQDRLIELINKEIDGLNSASEHQELTEHVSSNEHAAKLYNDLLRTATALKEVQQVPAPAYLKTHVMNSIHAAPARVDRRGAWLSSWFALSRSKPVVRYAVVFVSGLCVGLLFLVLATPWQQGAPDASNISGSMVLFPDLRRLPMLESARFEGDGVNGTFSTYKNNENIFVEIEVLSSDEISIELNSDPLELRFDGIRRLPGAAGEVNVTQGRVLVSGTRSEQAVIAFSAVEPVKGSVEGRLYRGSKLVHRALLKVH